MFNKISNETRTAVLALLFLAVLALCFTFYDYAHHGDLTNLYFVGLCLVLALVAYGVGRRQFRS